MKQKSAKAASTSSVNYEDLESIIRMKVQGFIQDILEEEVTALLGRERHERIRGDIDRFAGYRNGHGKPRRLSLMNGTIDIRRPRVRGLEERFESRVLPLFKRRTREVGDMLPELYLHGLASGDFELALRGLLGDGAPLSASSIGRLKAKWELEYAAWRQEDLSHLEVVYQWADGLYVKAGIDDRKSALLVIIAGLKGGEKAILACEGGQRESSESWGRILRDLKNRGLKLGRLTVADGHLGIWTALGEHHPEGDEQRCWNHKIVNILDRLPKREHSVAKELLRGMAYAGNRSECEQKRKAFELRYHKTDPDAVKTLNRDWDRMVTFFSYPKEHWIHLRTTNIVESPFATVRLRTNASKRYKRVAAATAMIWKMLRVAEKSFRRLNGVDLLPAVFNGVKFKDGHMVKTKTLHPREDAA